MDTTTQRQRRGRVPKDANCPKNAANRAAYHRKMERLRKDTLAYQRHLDSKADYQRAYRQTERGHAVMKSAEERWQASNPNRNREYYQTTIRPSVVARTDEIIDIFDSTSECDRREFVKLLCDAAYGGDYITMFAMQWAAVSDRIRPYLVQLGEDDE